MFSLNLGLGIEITVLSFSQDLAYPSFKHIFSDQTGPSGTKQVQVGPNRSMWDQTGPKKAKQVQKRPNRSKKKISCTFYIFHCIKNQESRIKYLESRIKYQESRIENKSRIKNQESRIINQESRIKKQESRIEN